MICKFACNPIDKIFVTQYFGENPDFYKKYGLKGHNGIDFRTRFPDTPLGRREIFAVDDGVVVKVVRAQLGGYGTYVQLQHIDSSTTIYGHQYNPHVSLGQSVKAGYVIGITDNTGDSTGPHLHFGYRPPHADPSNGYGGYVDPLKFLTIDIKKSA